MTKATVERIDGDNRTLLASVDEEKGFSPIFSVGNLDFKLEHGLLKDDDV